MKDCGMNGGPTSPQIKPRVQTAGEVGEGPGALQLGASLPARDNPVGPAWDNAAAGAA